MEDLQERIRLQEELIDDLKDELIVLHAKYGEVLAKVNEDLDRMYSIMGLIR